MHLSNVAPCISLNFHFRMKDVGVQFMPVLCYELMLDVECYLENNIIWTFNFLHKKYVFGILLRSVVVQLHGLLQGVALLVMNMEKIF